MVDDKIGIPFSHLEIIFPELLTADVEHTDWATGQDFLVIQTKQMPDDVLN